MHIKYLQTNVSSLNIWVKLIILLLFGSFVLTFLYIRIRSSKLVRQLFVHDYSPCHNLVIFKNRQLLALQISLYPHKKYLLGVLMLNISVLFLIKLYIFMRKRLYPKAFTLYLIYNFDIVEMISEEYLRYISISELLRSIHFSAINFDCCQLNNNRMETNTTHCSSHSFLFLAIEWFFESIKPNKARYVTYQSNKY